MSTKFHRFITAHKFEDNNRTNLTINNTVELSMNHKQLHLASNKFP